MTTKPANAICLGGPCHGALVRIGQDIGRVLVPLSSPDDGAAKYHVTRERVRYPSCREPLVVLHWAHPFPSYCQATSRPRRR
jgi:hypothetical protein